MFVFGQEQPFAKLTVHGRSLQRGGRIVGQQHVSATRPFQSSGSLVRTQMTTMQSPGPASSL